MHKKNISIFVLMTLILTHAHGADKVDGEKASIAHTCIRMISAFVSPKYQLDSKNIALAPALQYAIESELSQYVLAHNLDESTTTKQCLAHMKKTYYSGREQGRFDNIVLAYEQHCEERFNSNTETATEEKSK